MSGTASERRRACSASIATTLLLRRDIVAVSKNATISKRIDNCGYIKKMKKDSVGQTQTSPDVELVGLEAGW
jgi:hypothetical protein